MRWLGWLATLTLLACSTPKHGNWLTGSNFIETLYPAELESPEPPSGPRRVLKVRIYVDESFRAQALEWPRRIRGQVEAASRVLEAEIGAELEIEEIRDWPGIQGTSAQLESALKAIEKTDPGEGVDLVLGYVAPTPLVTPAIHELGIASLLGRHLVLRLIDDGAEYQALERLVPSSNVFNRLSPLYQARLAHKETVVLLHEVGHVLGAIHSLDGTDIMAPNYDTTVSHFLRWNRDAMRIAARAHGPQRDDAEARERALKELAEHLDRAEADLMAEADRSFLRRLLTGDRAKLLGATDRSLWQPKAEGAEEPLEQRFERYARAHDRRVLEVALELMRARPNDPKVAPAACWAMAEHDPLSAEAVPTCALAVSLTPTQATSRKNLVHVLLEQKKDEEALVAVHDAERSAAAADPDFACWIADRFSRLVSPSWTVAAAERCASPGPKKVLEAWAESVWASTGLSPGRRPKPEAERAYLLAREAILGHLHRGELDLAKEKNMELAKAAPEVPDASLAFCAHFQAKKQRTEAKDWCQRAIRADAEAAEPRYRMGAVLLESGALDQGLRSLESALSKATSTKDMWRFVRYAYRALGRSSQVAPLERAYAQRFAEPMPAN